MDFKNSSHKWLFQFLTKIYRLPVCPFSEQSRNSYIGWIWKILELTRALLLLWFPRKWQFRLQMRNWKFSEFDLGINDVFWVKVWKFLDRSKFRIWPWTWTRSFLKIVGWIWTWLENGVHLTLLKAFPLARSLFVNRSIDKQSLWSGLYFSFKYITFILTIAS